MKKMTKSFAPRLVSALMALLLFFTAFASFGGIKVQAAIGYVPAPEGDGVTDVYYLFDYYPEIGNADMANNYPEVDIVYDRCTNIQQVLPLIAVGIYNPIESLPAGCTVVIDIKTYKPNSEMLRDVFWYIQDSLHCKTIFVSTYQRGEFDDSIEGASMFEYLDDFYHSTDIRLEAFCDFSSQDVKDENGTLEDTCILIDGNIVNFTDLFGNYSFLRILIDKLCIALECEDHIPIPDYNAIISHLKEYHNISLLVHTSETSFVDLAGSVVQAPSNSYPNQSYQLNYGNIYAIGFSHLDNNFYDYLYGVQQAQGITVYILEAEPIVYSEDGLEIISDYALGIAYNADNYDLHDFMERLMGIVELS